MDIVPPYPKYPFFRGSSDFFCAATLADLSILAYSNPSFIKDVLSNTKFNFLAFVNVGNTQAIVVENRGYIGVAFRGTESFDLEDWMIDFNVKMVDGMHEGFLEAAKTVIPEVNELVHGKETYYTGHSLGAALATICSIYCLHTISRLVTFGSPRVGNADFASEVARITRQCDRYVHGKDVVPTLPPENMGYRHVGSAIQLAQRPRPWSNIFVPRKVYDHVPTLYGDPLWGA